MKTKKTRKQLSIRKNKYNKYREDYDAKAAYNKNTDLEYPTKQDKYRKTYENGFGGGKYKSGKFQKQNFEQDNYNYNKNQEGNNAGYQNSKPNYPKNDKRGGDYQNYKQTEFEMYNDFKDSKPYKKNNDFKKQDDYTKQNEFEIYNAHDANTATGYKHNDYTNTHGDYKPSDQSKNYKTYYDSTKPKNDSSGMPYSNTQQNWKQGKVEQEAGNENKPIFSDQRKRENKALFEKQIKSIQKTLLPNDTKEHFDIKSKVQSFSILHLAKTPYTESTGVSRIHKCKFIISFPFSSLFL